MHPVLFIHQVLKAYQEQLEARGKPARVLVRKEAFREVEDQVTISREAKELYAKSRSKGA